MNRASLILAALACTVLLAAQRRAGPAGPAFSAVASNPFAGNQAAIEEGRGVYNNTCTGCHGPNGTAGEIGPGLAVAGHSYSRNSDAQIFDAIKNGIPDTPMPAHSGKLTDDQIWKVTAYVRGLRGTAIDAPSPGNVAHGEEIFWGKGQCGTCHMMHGKGSVVGPDLSNIAGIRKTSSIIDALTKVNHRVFSAGGAQPHRLPLENQYPVVDVTLADGHTVRGVLRNQDSFSIQMMGLDQKLYLLDRAKLKSIVFEKNSLMPTDYDKRLTPDEFNALLAFLTRQGTSSLNAAAPRRTPD
ncbi:MAG TPA: c-type cytochrome [Rhizomicrobium sp.]|jgi:putative heme-binding domain-containing protein|nr:c-type cytochrome [Rhizomicrobium sp.]